MTFLFERRKSCDRGQKISHCSSKLGNNFCTCLLASKDVDDDYDYDANGKLQMEGNNYGKTQATNSWRPPTSSSSSSFFTNFFRKRDRYVCIYTTDKFGHENWLLSFFFRQIACSRAADCKAKLILSLLKRQLSENK